MKRILLSLLFATFSFSLHAEFFRGPVSAALGGAAIAGIQGSESVFVNPALVPLIQGSEMTAYYEDGYIGPAAHRQAFGLGAVDVEKDVYFPGSLHYLRLRDTGRASAAADGELWHAAFGKNIF